MEFCRDAAGCVSHFVDGMWMFVVPWLALCRDCVYRGLGLYKITSLQNHPHFTPICVFEANVKNMKNMKIYVPPGFDSVDRDFLIFLGN